jgi:hypothetical protein
MILSSDNILDKMGLIKGSIKEYLAPENKLLLLNILYFLSVKTGVVHFNTDQDFASFNKLLDYCKQADIPAEKYVVCFFKYCNKYLQGGHKVKLSYLLNEKIISYCGQHINTALVEYNLLQTLKNDILYTEKSVRDYSTEHGISYNKSVLTFNKSDALSEAYLLYKYYMADELFSGVELSHNKQILLACLEPFFLYITSRNGVFSKTLISSWNNSKLEDFKFCPVFFRDRYLTKEIDYPSLMSNEASTTGTCVHNAFEELINKYNSSKNKNLQKSYERFLQSKSFIYLEANHPEHIPGFKEFFTKTLPSLINPDTQILTEQLMKMTYGEYTLYGTADLILVNGDEAILLDYKTSKIDQEFWLKENNKKYGKQLSLYAAFIKHVIPGVKTVTDAYIIYTRGLVHKVEELSDTILDDTIARIIEIKQHIKLKSFIPNTKSCLLCRHPTCENRAKESMWNLDGSRKIK